VELAYRYDAEEAKEFSRVEKGGKIGASSCLPASLSVCLLTCLPVCLLVG
jgi:hypothetical protein